MKEVFRYHDFALVGLCKSALLEAGIPISMRNENLSTFEIPAPAFQPAVCVIHEKDYARAREIVLSIVSPSEVTEEDWQCSSCGESNPGNFEICFACSAEKPVFEL